MTCIAAVAGSDGVYMAWDSACTGDGNIHTTSAKVVRGPGYLLGGAGDAGVVAALAMATFKPGPLRTTADVLRCVAKPIAQAWDKLGFDASEERWAVLVACASGRLWYIVDRLVILPIESTGAIGSGSAHALGALYANVAEDSETRVRVAVEAACAHGNGCAPPIYVARAKSVAPPKRRR